MRRLGLVVVLFALVVSACGSDGDGDPGDDSPEAGFARDMAVHHAQAVEMADTTRARTDDPALQAMATDIVLTQQNQIGRMQGWLEAWGLPLASTDPPMAWAGEHGGHGTMPGLATDAEIEQLSSLPVPEAEVLFLELMIAHHQGGIEMAEAVLELTDQPEVVRLATAIVNSQQAEISAMEDMLAERAGAAG